MKVTFKYMVLLNMTANRIAKSIVSPGERLHLRARELAHNAGRGTFEITKSDYDQAKRESKARSLLHHQKMKKAIAQAIKVMGDRFGSTEQDVARAIQELKASMQGSSEPSLAVKAVPGPDSQLPQAMQATIET
jgi:hypothetical protein